MIRFPYSGRKVWAVLEAEGRPAAVQCEIVCRTGCGWHVRSLECAYVRGNVDRSRMYRTQHQAQKRARDEMRFRRAL